MKIIQFDYKEESTKQMTVRVPSYWMESRGDSFYAILSEKRAVSILILQRFTNIATDENISATKVLAHTIEISESEFKSQLKKAISNIEKPISIQEMESMESDGTVTI